MQLQLSDEKVEWLARTGNKQHGIKVIEERDAHHHLRHYLTVEGIDISTVHSSEFMHYVKRMRQISLQAVEARAAQPPQERKETTKTRRPQFFPVRY